MIASLALAVVARLLLPAAAAAQPEPVDARRAVLDLLIISDSLERPLLALVRGASPSDFEQRLQQLRPDAPIRFEALPELGKLDERVALAMGQYGADCALSLERRARQRWSLRLWGSCASQPGVAAGDELPPGARVALAFIDDPRDSQDLRDELSLGLQEGPGRYASAAWYLSEGSGYELDSFRFALQVGDLPSVARLERERRSRRAIAASLGVVGATAGFAGLCLSFRGLVQAGRTSSYEEQVRFEQLTWTGLVVQVGGGLALSGIPSLRRSLHERWQRPDRFYAREEVQVRIDDYNRQLSRELGLPEVKLRSEPDDGERP